MSPSIVLIPYVGLIIPVRFAFSVALLFVAIKSNVVSSFQGLDWATVPGHILLTTTALVNVVLAAISLALAGIREEDALPPVIRWKCACCALIVRGALFPLAVCTIVVVAQNATHGHFRVNELVLAEITLGLLIIWYIWGAVRKIRVMKAANAAGEEEVRMEITRKRAEIQSATQSTVSTPQSIPTIMSHSPNGVVVPLSLGPSNHGLDFAGASTDSLKTSGDSCYGKSGIYGTSAGSSRDKFSTHSYA